MLGFRVQVLALTYFLPLATLHCVCMYGMSCRAVSCTAYVSLAVPAGHHDIPYTHTHIPMRLRHGAMIKSPRILVHNLDVPCDRSNWFAPDSPRTKPIPQGLDMISTENHCTLRLGCLQAERRFALVGDIFFVRSCTSVRSLKGCVRARDWYQAVMACMNAARLNSNRASPA